MNKDILPWVIGVVFAGYMMIWLLIDVKNKANEREAKCNELGGISVQTRVKTYCLKGVEEI